MWLEAQRELPGIRSEELDACIADAKIEGVRPEYAADYLLAWAAARGNSSAIRRVDAAIAATRTALRSFDRRKEFLDEVNQRVRVRLLVAVGGNPARIATYSGRGSLSAWLKVIATRIALDIKRADRPGDSDSVLAELASGEPDPELRCLKVQYRSEFREALTEALANLPDRDRTVLRLHFVEGLRLAEIASLYDVHESTVSRWVKNAGAAAMDSTRNRLTERLSLSTATFDSLARALQSQLDLSITAVLG